MMTGKEKLFFLLDAIEDAKDITPSSQPLVIDPTNNLNRRYRAVELSQLFTKLEKDERVLTILKIPHRVKDIDEIENLDPYDHADDGCWHIILLPAFDDYFLKIQHELEYQEFTGRKPMVDLKPKLSKKSFEKIWNLMQEIEDKRGITAKNDDITIPFVHWSKVKNEREAKEYSDERRNILRKLEIEDEAIVDVRLPDNLNEYVYLKIGGKYYEMFNYYKKEYESRVKEYQQKNSNKYNQVLSELDEQNKKSSEDLQKRYDKALSDTKLISASQDVNTSIKIPEWSEDFRWEGGSLVFGEYGKLDFNSKTTKAIFTELHKARGNWVDVKRLKDATSKDIKGYLRPTIGQIEQRMNEKLKKYISFPSTTEDDLEPKPTKGAYRIKYSPKSQ